MKKNMLGLIIIGAVLLGTTATFAIKNIIKNDDVGEITNFNSGKNIKTKVSLDEAKKIALKDAKSGNIKSAKLENEEGVNVFKIEILDGTVKKDYEIDARTGEIVKREIDSTNSIETSDSSSENKSNSSNSSNNDNSKNNSNNNSNKSSNNSSNKNSNNSSNNNSSNNSNNNSNSGNSKNNSNSGSSNSNTNNGSTKITIAQAKQIALAHSKGGKITKVELDRENGVLVYEIEIKVNGMEKEYKINAETGKIIEYKSEVDDD